MFVHWSSLKFRLAITTALLMGLGVALTVIHAVREAQERTEQSILETHLGVGQIAAALSARVVERQRALSAAARAWKPQTATRGAQAADFLARQAVLRALFDRVLLIDAGALPDVRNRLPQVSSPVLKLNGTGSADILLAVPLTTTEREAPLLAGALSIRSVNFLSDAARPEGLAEAQLQTIVADQQGQVLAHADPTRLLGRIDDEAELRKMVVQWRRQGSPLEPAPWTRQIDGHFVAMAAVPGTDWLVIRTAPAEALFGRASRSIFRTIVTGAVIGLIGAIVIFVVTARLLQPMSRLQRRAMRALDPTQPAHEGWPTARGEVGQLSDVLRHVSERLASSRSDMVQSLRQMRAVLDHAPAGLAFTNEGRFALVSRELERMLGYEEGGLDGGSWEELLPQSCEALWEDARNAHGEGRRNECELQVRRRDGSLLWVRLQGTVVQGGGFAHHKIWIVADATHARRQREQLVWSATHDPLTDLVNRREFEHQLRTLVADRRRRSPACALFIDLDHFKKVNDSVGHGAGDKLLKQVAWVLQLRLRDEDTVARLGGDEFAVLLRGCGLRQALQVAEQIRAEVQVRGKVEHAPVGVTASIGVVEISDALPTLAAVLDAADEACYAAKRSGRNAVHAASPDLAPNVAGISAAGTA
jgi:diguanylate cyclase (GGDEF)-like protein/PAS domain S-box-containing protein